MAPSFFISLLLLSLMSFFQFSSTQPLCREFERLALEQFKDSFLIKRNASASSIAYPKVDLWKSQGSDCCSWKGITCSQHTGHVVGIELKSSCLFGSINSSSTLFRLAHLRYLNLADNHFNYSSIPPAFGNLSRLISLDLSYSWFSGQVPFEISKLSKLTKLDLSWNFDFSNQGLLQLKTQDFKSLIHNLTRLEYLRLSSVNINSSVPHALANLSSLTYLGLSQCELFGEFPNAIFQLPKLEILYVSDNSRLTGILPEFHFSNPLTELDIGNTSFSGEIPKSLGLLSSLEYLVVRTCDFSGILPSSLPSNLTKPYFFSLRVLDISFNQISGEIPPDFCNMTSLQYLDLSLNYLSGIIPQCLGNRSSSPLTNLRLGENNLQGKLPRSLANCKDLEYLDVRDNQIRDTFPSWLGLLPHLKVIILRSNRFHGEIDDSESGSLFPELRTGDLSQNELMGRLPLNYFRKWNIMVFLDKDEEPYVPFNVTYSKTDEGRMMDFQKTLYLFSAIDLSSNKFSGEIPEVVDNLRRLQLLNLSNNNLIGPVPPGLGYLSKLEALDLSNNKLTGTIPPELTQLHNLAIFNVSNNLLTGPTPQGNQFDTFGNNSFQGNPGLCGMPLSKKCGNHLPLPLWKATVDEENKHITSLLFEIGWRAVLIGFGCGVLGGVVLGVKVFARQQKWLMETFRIKQGRRKSGNRRR